MSGSADCTCQVSRPEDRAEGCELTCNCAIAPPAQAEAKACMPASPIRLSRSESALRFPIAPVARAPESAASPLSPTALSVATRSVHRARAPLAHARASTTMCASAIQLGLRRAPPLLPRITSMPISNFHGSRSAAKLVQRSETLAWQRLSTCESNTGGASMATCATSTSGTSVHISHCQLFYSLRVPLSKGTGRIQLEGVTECRMHVLPRSPCCSPVAPVAPSAP